MDECSEADTENRLMQRDCASPGSEENGRSDDSTTLLHRDNMVLDLKHHNINFTYAEDALESDFILKDKQRNLYPHVVVSSRDENGELDSDEEEYQLRMHKRSDSGHGSSITDSSVNTGCNDTKRTDLTEADSPQESQGDLSSDLGEESCNSSPVTFYGNGVNRASFDEHVVEALKDIQVGSDEPLGRYRSGSLLNSKKTSQASSIDLDDTDFTDIPLSNTVSPKGNTYAPRPLSSKSPEPPESSELHPPAVTDRKPNARLFNKSNKTAWKLFGRGPINVPSEAVMQQEAKKISKSSPVNPKKAIVATSTTGLILENRPAHLPPKSQKEELKHKMLYDEMILEAKKKEVRDMQKQKKKEKMKQKQEEIISNSLRCWKEEIIPNWNSMRSTRKAKELWWFGLPPSVRGIVWKLAIGNDLHITPDDTKVVVDCSTYAIELICELFKIFQVHYQQKMYQSKNSEVVATLHDSESSLVVSKENTVGLISLDVSRTFPSLCIFQKGGPYHESLKNLLGAYTCYRPDVGYVQGMSFLAAMLLLNLEPVDAFLSFSNLLNNPCQMAFFMVDQPMMEAYFCTFDVLLEEALPKLHSHFLEQKLSHDIYLIDWIFTLFSKSLPLDVACRVWDLFARDGEEFLFRTALGILNLYKEVLITMDFFHLAQYLTKLSDSISSDKLFACIGAITFSSQKFFQILELQKKRIGRD